MKTETTTNICLSNRGLALQAINQIVKTKRSNGVSPALATIHEIVDHTGMFVSDVNCELSKLIGHAVEQLTVYKGGAVSMGGVCIWGYVPYGMGGDIMREFNESENNCVSYKNGLFDDYCNSYLEK